MDVDKLNGAVEEMTQATADSYRRLLEASCEIEQLEAYQQTARTAPPC